MNNESKMVLKIGLVIYSILFAFSVINHINSKLMPELFSISTIYIYISSYILFAYTLTNGSRGIAKAGIILIFISLIIGALQSFNVITISAFDGNDLHYILHIINNIKTNFLSLLDLLAIFSLINTYSENKQYGTIAILIASILIILGIIEDVIKFKSKLPYNSTFFTIKNIISNASTYAKYATIMIYLIGKKEMSEGIPTMELSDFNNVNPQTDFAKPVIERPQPKVVQRPQSAVIERPHPQVQRPQEAVQRPASAIGTGPIDSL